MNSPKAEPISRASASDERPQRPATPAILAGLGLLATGGIVFLAVTLRSPTAVTSLEGSALVAAPKGAPDATAVKGTPAAGAKGTPATTGSAPDGDASEKDPAHAPPAELDRAQASGIQAVTALAQRYPNDPAVLRALAIVQGREQGYAAALPTVKRLLELAPDEADNDEVRQLLMRTANGTPDVAAVVLDLMAKRLGSRGLDMLYEIVTAQKFGDYPRNMASRLLLDSSVRQSAPPALLIADDLRRASATGCPPKPLVVRARGQGDARSLPYLKALLMPQKCGFKGRRKCIKCVLIQRELMAAAGAIEQRRGDGPSSTEPQTPSQ